MPSVFISRDLKPGSPFHDLGKQWTVTAESLLEFRAVPITRLPAANWYFFYSARGASFFLQQTEPPTGVQLGCLGQSAAQVLQAAGYTPQFIGEGDPKKVAEAWLPHVKQQKVVFVQAQQSRASVKKLLSGHIQATELVVYDNRMREQVAPLHTDYLIFTSPLNFQAYIQHHSIGSQQRLIGIGSTTAVTFSAASVKEYRIAKFPSEAGLKECLLEWEQEKPQK